MLFGRQKERKTHKERKKRKKERKIKKERKKKKREGGKRKEKGKESGRELVAKQNFLYPSSHNLTVKPRHRNVVVVTVVHKELKEDDNAVS